MRAVDLVRIAVEAESLRLRHMLKRQGRRAAFGLVAVIFGLGVLVLANVAGWQILRLYVPPIYATLGEDVRGPWNEAPDFEYVAEPAPMGGLPAAPNNPDDERPVSMRAKAKPRQG